MRLLIALIFAVLLAPQMNAYTLPQHIPDGVGFYSPWTDYLEFTDTVCPSPPGDWSSPVLGYYAVNAATGNDSGNTYGTPAAPRETIPAALGVGTLVVLYGDYDITHNGFGATGLGPVGTAESPVCITRGDTGAIVGQFDLKNAAYVIFDDVKWDSALTGCCQFQVMGTAHYIHVRDSEITGSTAGGGWAIFGSSASEYVTFFSMFNTDVHDVGEWDDVSTDNDIHCGKIGRWVSQVWISGGEHHHCGGDAVQVDAGETCPGGPDTCVTQENDTSFIFLGGMEIHHNRQSGLWMKFARDVVMASNNCYTMTTHTESNSFSPVCFGGQYLQKRLWIIGNLVTGSRDGIRIASQNRPGWGTEILIVGNLLRNGNAASGALSACDNSAIDIWGGDDILVAWNTVYNWPQGYCEPQGHNYGNRQVHNNLIDTVDAANGGMHFKIVGNVASSTGLLSGNVTNSPYRQDFNGTFASQTAPYDNGFLRVVADTMMTNPAGGQFGLQAGSPALDFNVTTLLGVSAYYQALYGKALSVDYLGNPRYVGQTDAGWLERAAALRSLGVTRYRFK